MTDADVVVGTALYIAPEQVTKEPISPAADIYALGTVAYHCLAGHPPFLGDTALEVAMRHVDDDVPPLPDDVPAAAREFVAIALAKDPAERFASAAAMAEAAERVVEAIPDHSTADFSGLVRAAASAPPPAVRNTRRWRGLVATVAAGVAALAVILAMRDPAGERPRPIAPPPTSAPTAGLPGGPVDPAGTGTRSGSARTAGPANGSSTMVPVPGRR
jgi:serine/threonine-protein kinase